MNTIIAGDLNAKNTLWNSKTTNPAGNESERYLDTRLDTTVAAPDTPPHYPNNPNHNPDILDIALLKTGNISYHIENLEDKLTSDHTPVLLDIQERSKQIPPPRPLWTINWEKFKEELENELSVNNLTRNKEQIYTAIEELTKAISQTLERNSTQFVPTDRKQDLLRNILAEIYLKRSLRSQWQKTRHPSIKTSLHKQAAKVKKNSSTPTRKKIGQTFWAQSHPSKTDGVNYTHSTENYSDQNAQTIH